MRKRPGSFIERVELASRHGAKTVALTDWGNGLARGVDACLHIRPAQAGVALEQSNPMRFARLLVIDCLAYSVAECRADAGDAETGAGLEVGGGLGYARGNLSLEVNARALVAHEDTEYQEWGFSSSTPRAGTGEGCP